MARGSTGKNDELQAIPGVGPSLSKDLHDLGVRQVSDLTKRDPQVMYEDLCDLRNTHQDRCVLYVFRCAVYYARNSDRDPELLKWWNWTDARMQARA
ncbi:MAG: helix-hairpin-helix domain-containing protein [Actinomycetota bacterium]